MIRSQFGIDYSGAFEPVIQEVESISYPLGELWADGLQAYRELR